MADGSGNINRSKTGTVPKIKYSNNASAAAIHSIQDQSKGPRTPNNLFAQHQSWHTYTDSSVNLPQNKERNQRFKYTTMDPIAFDRSDIPLNGVTNYPAAGAVANDVTPTTSSSSTSRRNSSGGGGGSSLKCDNVTKYPDRKHIEDKLKQIREYLEVTSSLMTNIRNSDEQIFDIDEKTHLLQMRNDLLDSERKLVNLLEEIDNNQRDDEEENQEACATNCANASQAAAAAASNNVENLIGLNRSTVEMPPSDQALFDNELVALHDREQQQQRYRTQQKSENKLLDGQRHQEKSFLANCSNQLNIGNEKNNKNLSLAEFDSAIKDLEERTKRLNRNHHGQEESQQQQQQQQSSTSITSNQKYQADKLMQEMQNLHSQIVSMHNVNNEREQLIQVLDNRDSDLRLQQAELKKKLMELQTKKEQVDYLVTHLQNIEDEEQNDIGNQVRNIVTMKDHLRKLKDMLDLVNNVAENPATATNKLCITAENLQNEISKPTTTQHKRNDSYVENRLDNHVLNETYQKQSNKIQQQQKRGNQNGGGGGARPKQRTSSINEKIALHAELEAKKRELEEIMGKHKAGTSNLNHDVIGNPLDNMAWKPPIFSREQTMEMHNDDDDEEEEDDDHLSSSNGDDNDVYQQESPESVADPPENLISPQQLNYMDLRRQHRHRHHHTESSRRQSSPPPSNEYDDNACELNQIESPHRHRQQQMASNANAAERNLINLASNREQSQCSNKLPPHKFQQDLELIKKVCDAVLERLQQSTDVTGTQQNRNNATPSPVYSERQLQQQQQQPRVSLSPSPFCRSHNSPNHQINVFNSSSTPSNDGDLPPSDGGGTTAAACFAGPNNNNNNSVMSDMNNFQNWLATSSVQTQTCLMLTLNQCCQLILMQQRELEALRQSVAMLQANQFHHPSSHGNLPTTASSQFIQNNQIPNNLVHHHQTSAAAAAAALPSQFLNGAGTGGGGGDSPHSHSHNPIQYNNNNNNQVSSACSLPNLNQYNTVTSSSSLLSTNNDLAFPPPPHPSTIGGNNNSSNISLLEMVLHQLTAASTQPPPPPPQQQQHHHQQHNNVLHAASNQHGGVAPPPPLPPAPHMWNGQALNNQVPPGNRANNYWDNFRSYSRQNQLSSKNSESSFQNISSTPAAVATATAAVASPSFMTATDRFNITANDRSLINPYQIMQTQSKTNSEHSSTNSHETTPKKKTAKNPPTRSYNIDHVPSSVATVGGGGGTTGRSDYQTIQAPLPPPPPPDVLNVNQNTIIINKTNFDDSNEMNEFDQQQQQSTVDIESELGFHRLLNNTNQQSNNVLTIIDDDDDDDDDCATEDERNLSRNSITRNRPVNGWNSGGGGGGNDNQSEQRPKKNKLVEELRENVYKEVASLISANEARPHFLIQLFKDLKKIESDSLRLKTLQSIQNILTIHFQQAATAAHSRQLRESDSLTFLETSEPTSNWSRPSSKQFSSDILNICFDSDEPFLQNSYKDLVKLLEENRDDFLNNQLLLGIKQVILESEFFKESVKDAIFFKHFSNVLDDILEQFRGKKIQDIKVHLIQTLGDLLQGELSFIHLIQETLPENGGVMLPERKDSNVTASTIFDNNVSAQSSLQNDAIGSNGLDNIQNGDLAEADQSRINEENCLDDDEEEGAVGGLLDGIHNTESLLTSLSQGHSEEMLNTMSVIDFQTTTENNGEGLDQVPTRLAIKIKSGTATPTNDVLGGHHDSEPY